MVLRLILYTASLNLWNAQLTLQFLILLLKSGASTPIGEFIHGVLIPYLKHLPFIYKRVVIFDIYMLKNLKYDLRLTKGLGDKIRVCLNTKMPKNLWAFLHVDEHKH